MRSGGLLAREGTEGEPLFFEATVRNTKGEGIEGVVAEVVRLLDPVMLMLSMLILILVGVVLWCRCRGG